MTSLLRLSTTSTTSTAARLFKHRGLRLSVRAPFPPATIRAFSSSTTLSTNNNATSAGAPPPPPPPSSTTLPFPSLDSKAPEPTSLPPELDPNNPFPKSTLILDKCILRPLHATDAPSLQRAANSPGVARYMSEVFPYPFTLQDAYKWLVYGLRFRAPGSDAIPNLAICDPETNSVLGGVGVKVREDVEKGCFELGAWLGEESWGKGIMTEVLVEYSKWLFKTYPQVNRLEGGIFSGNEGSRKMVEKAGWVYEGTRRKAAVKNGEVFDILVYSLLREECEPLLR